MILVSGGAKNMTSLSTFGRCILGAALAALVLSGPPDAYAVVVFDNFSDLNDTANPTWTHLDAAVATTGQTWDASTGAYRLHSPTLMTGGSTSPGVEGYDFVGAHVGPAFTDVRVTADIVDFVPPGFQSAFFAVGARMNGVNLPPSEANGLEFRGYSYQYEGTARQGLGEMVLTIMNGSGLKDIGSFPLTLDPAIDYRVVFEVVGNTLHGQVFEVTDVANGGIVGAMVADQFRDLDANPPGDDDYDGPLNPVRPFIPYTSGFSGVYGVGHIFFTDPDFTIDNFKSESIGGLTGDYNENGVVDAADYVMWRNGDSPDDSQAGYDAWRANFGSTAGSGSGLGSGGAVPEPASAVLVIVGLVSLWLGRRNASR
jgi:hypothetical protein